MKEKLQLLPDRPGCYLMKDKDGDVIYVGKAKSLRHRVRSYFTGAHDTKTELLVSQIADFEYIVTKSTVEALILECNLIKKYRPRYNVMLKDDKSYPYIRLTKGPHPRLEVTRKLVKDGSKYFGPYPHAGAAHHAKKLLDRLFPLRKCRTLPKRVCLYYHLNQCLAPCEYEVTSDTYQEMVSQVSRFLKGDVSHVMRDLENQMVEAADKLEFERAKDIRDLMEDIRRLVEKQSMVIQDNVDRDIFGYAVDKGWMCVQVFFMRQGKLLERDVSIFPFYNESKDDFTSFVAQFYHEHPSIPKEILLPEEVDEELLCGIFSQAKIPKRGVKRDLVKMAMENATFALQERFRLMERDELRTIQSLEELGSALKIGIPHRIEAFDNSNIQGVHPVSAMVVFVDGKPSKKEYRKFHIRTVEKVHDVDTMAEVIRRRYTRVLKENLPLPDLVLVDGGKAQMAAAMDVLENELGLYIPVAGMVKNEKHQTAALLYGDPSIEVELDHRSQSFYLIQRIQEEVHRFAISFHRQVRGKEMLQSELDQIEGVGSKRRQQLYQHFGSIDRMREATIEEYKKAGIGEKLAKKILDALRKG